MKSLELLPQSATVTFALLVQKRHQPIAKSKGFSKCRASHRLHQNPTNILDLADTGRSTAAPVDDCGHASTLRLRSCSREKKRRKDAGATAQAQSPCGHGAQRAAPLRDFAVAMRWRRRLRFCAR